MLPAMSNGYSSKSVSSEDENLSSSGWRGFRKRPPHNFPSPPLREGSGVRAPSPLRGEGVLILVCGSRLWRQPLHVPQQVAQLASVQLPLDLGRGAHPHAPQLDEPGGGRLVELIALAVSGEGELV